MRVVVGWLETAGGTSAPPIHPTPALSVSLIPTIQYTNHNDHQEERKARVAEKKAALEAAKDADMEED